MVLLTRIVVHLVVYIVYSFTRFCYTLAGHFMVTKLLLSPAASALLTLADIEVASVPLRVH